MLVMLLLLLLLLVLLVLLLLRRLLVWVMGVGVVMVLLLLPLARVSRSGTTSGLLRGLHNLDTCDAFIAPSPTEAGLSVEGQAGEGGVSSVEGFPPAGASARFLEAHLEGWRRLDCAEPFALALAGLPQGLAVLSLQVRNAAT